MVESKNTTYDYNGYKGESVPDHLLGVWNPGNVQEKVMTCGRCYSEFKVRLTGQGTQVPGQEIPVIVMEDGSIKTGERINLCVKCASID